MKANEYFKDYPGKTKCFETSDGLIFHEKGDAQYHADGLKDNEVVMHKNKAAVVEVEETETNAEAETEKPAKGNKAKGSK